MRFSLLVFAPLALCAQSHVSSGSTVSGNTERNVSGNVKIAPAKKPQATASTASDNVKYFIDSFTVPIIRPSPPVGNPSNPLCYMLAENVPLSAEEIISYVGKRDGLSLTARGNRVLIFSTKPQNAKNGNDQALVNELKAQMGQMAGIGSFRVELSIPHAPAVGDIVSKIRALNYHDLNVEMIGSDKVRISSDSAPDCGTWTSFLTNVRDLAWRPYPVPPVDKVFFLNGPDVSEALNSTGAVSTLGAGKTGGSSSLHGTAASKPTSASVKADSTAKAGASEGEETADEVGSEENPQTTDETDPPSSDKSGTKAAKGKGTKSSASAGKNPATPQSSTTGKSAGKAESGADASTSRNAEAVSNPVTATTLVSEPDLLVFSEPTPGDDAAIAEKRRVIAALDLPRPEMLVNVWSSQFSGDDLHLVVNESQRLRSLVNTYNERLQEAILRGWLELKRLAAEGNFYDKPFYQYIANRMVYDLPSPKVQNMGLVSSANRFLLYGDNKASLTQEDRKNWGLCAEGRYCLGYTELFNPLKPRLTDLLLAAIAAQNPAEAITKALNAMEKTRVSIDVNRDESCEVLDDKGYQASNGQPQFECFRRVTDLMFNPESEGPTPHAVGELRSAVADFLYNWKIANEFPHEFSAYDLDRSAQTLNAALAPLVDSFNRDITSYQTILREKFEDNSELPKKAILREKFEGNSEPPKKSQKAFSNSGIVTVRTVSGKETIVDTATQSYLDVSEAPTLAQLTNAISQAGSGTFPAGVKGNITTAAVLGAANAMKPSDAKIGRGLKLDIMPRALAGATSAELDVTLNAAETAEPALFTGGQKSDVTDNTSRVATHNTTTKIRVESLKIVDVSSLWARLQRSRTRIPLIPPLVELPYIGTLVGIPRKPASEYHSSTAVITAVVIPTAADLAFGTRFEPDRIAINSGTPQNPHWEFRSAVGFGDFRDLDLERLPVRNYHRAIMICFATGLVTPGRVWMDTAQQAPDDAARQAPDPVQQETDCSKIKFSNLPGEPQQ